MENINKEFNGRLICLTENCIFAYDQLCKVNKELNEEHSRFKRNDFSSNVDFGYLGAMNRMIQDYLIVRVAGLFDEAEYRAKGETHEVVCFEKTLSGNEIYKRAKNQEIIKYIQHQRNNFVAHFNVNAESTVSSKICDSDLKKILLELKTLVN